MKANLLEKHEQFIFDFDSTLSAIEGIDELARMNKVFEVVSEMTNQAMNSTSLSTETYAKRLEITKPTLEQVQSLGKLYVLKMVEGVLETFELLHKANKQVFILSGGILQSILPLAKVLKVPKENVFAVKIFFNKDGTYKDFERTSPLVQKGGKSKVLLEKILNNSTSILIGDGMSDAETKNVVTTFLGFGGVVYREKVEKISDFYLKSSNLKDLFDL
ncbi:HAD-IB family phosphatase [bacterium]|nr:HAD-IB family phosphatase [bacterium]